MKFEVGSLVRLRDRDWVVQPHTDDSTLLVKPLGGLEGELACVYPELEEISPSVFPHPNPDFCGDAASCALLRDAARLGIRSTAGPFRSFGHIAMEPRPYQLVPLIMAMRQETTRLLIADDVGVGKTVEALLIARELLDRGEIKRMSILCPSQLTDQWQSELKNKFHIEAELVIPSTIRRLEKTAAIGESIFEKYPFTVVSLDFIKSNRHRLDFLRACPELLIIDEAHTCASAADDGGTRRFELVSELARKPDRHMLFVTATPHSGKEDVFRSLINFLNPELKDLPEDLSGKENEANRRKLAEYFIQRRRGDIRGYLDRKTIFPERKTQELTWRAGKKWKKLFDDSLDLAREAIASRENGTEWQKRVGWWAALALLRAVSSSPAAAAQALSNKAQGLDEERDVADLDRRGERALYDRDSGDEDEVIDILPGADVSLGGDESRRRYLELAKRAKELQGIKKDDKLRQLAEHIDELLDGDGKKKRPFSPIIFCRFIATADYVASELSRRYPQYAVWSITGKMTPNERRHKVEDLAKRDRRILVCTDCLSEGINLQENFDAVIHYDLSWNPTRHEQREGRVDRFGQPRDEVRAITWWGENNSMDGMLLEVLLRKHEAIRKSLGISVPVPEDCEKIVDTLVKALLEKQSKKEERGLIKLPGMDDYYESAKKRASKSAGIAWDLVKERTEKRSNTFFAQQTVKTEEADALLKRANEASGGGLNVEDFVNAAYQLLGGDRKTKEENGQKIYYYSFDAGTRARHMALDFPRDNEPVVFDLPIKKGQTYLNRTNPRVEKLGAYLAETVLDEKGTPLLPRCGVTRTKAVGKRTTLLLLRLRFQIIASGEFANISLAEELAILGFSGSAQNPVFLSEDEAKATLKAEPDANVDNPQDWAKKVIDRLDELMPHIRDFQKKRADALLAEHKNARAVRRNTRYSAVAQGQPDIMGVFVYLPA